MAKKNVVVKRLSAIEDLGALEVLCSDKTGTLTENKLKVVDVYVPDNSSLASHAGKLNVEEIYAQNSNDCILKANLASGNLELSRNVQNNAFDIALMQKLSKSYKLKLDSYKKIEQIPFDPQRRRVTVIVKSIDKDHPCQYLITRGAPEEILAICKLSTKEEKELREWASDMGKKGKRVLAVAERKVDRFRHTGSVILLSNSNMDHTPGVETFEKDLNFLGLITFSDPIKKSAYEAVANAKKLGVSVKILTGDSSEVAASVAQEVKLITSYQDVITGS